jgi:hypothetical protein
MPEEIWTVGRKMHAAFARHKVVETGSGRNGVAVAFHVQKDLLIIQLEEDMDPDFIVTVGGTQGHMMFQHPYSFPGSRGMRGKTRETIITEALQSCSVDGEAPMKVGLTSRSTRSSIPGWRARVRSRKSESPVLVRSVK